MEQLGDIYNKQKSQIYELHLRRWVTPSCLVLTHRLQRNRSSCHRPHRNERKKHSSRNCTFGLFIFVKAPQPPQPPAPHKKKIPGPRGLIAYILKKVPLSKLKHLRNCFDSPAKFLPRAKQNPLLLDRASIKPDSPRTAGPACVRLCEKPPRRRVCLCVCVSATCQ